MAVINKIFSVVLVPFRKRRMDQFLIRIAPKSEEKILDVGGTWFNWRLINYRGRVDLLNLSVLTYANELPTNFTSIAGDGCKLQYDDNAFDIYFSNSVIEHVGSFERQKLFAKEACRVGRRIWIQTPAKSFFFEPHYLTPFIHWLPARWQKRLLRYFSVHGWLTRPTQCEVIETVDHTRLLTFEECVALFPDCTVRRERFLFMTKSYIIERR